MWMASLNPPLLSSNTGVGDVPVAVDQSKGIVVSDTVANQSEGHVTFVGYSINATNGKILWEDNLSYGGVPAAFKGGIPLIINNVAYIPDSSTGEEIALNVDNGNLLWKAVLPGIPLPPKFAGAPRGSPTYVDGYLIQLGGNSIYVMNATTGSLINVYKVGGFFGISNPVIVGNTMYLVNNYGWIIGMPLSQIGI